MVIGNLGKLNRLCLQGTYIDEFAIALICRKIRGLFELECEPFANSLEAVWEMSKIFSERISLKLKV